MLLVLILFPVQFEMKKYVVDITPEALIFVKIGGKLTRLAFDDKQVNK